MERTAALAAILRTLADALEDAARRRIQADAVAVASLVNDACNAWLSGQDRPQLGVGDAALAQHVAAYVASNKTFRGGGASGSW
jgi:hypothetical protein